MEFINNFFGVYADKLTIGNMVARGVLVFFISLLFIRISGIRTLGRQTSFDQLATFILGSILGRIVVTGGNFYGGLFAALAIMVCHRFVSYITFRSRKMGNLLKGEPKLLVERGVRMSHNLKRGHITEEDLQESMHVRLNTAEWNEIKEVYLERSGEISFIKYDKGK
jgi:uncharacterized membrane protein YcaP (DUF421 family)